MPEQKIYAYPVYLTETDDKEHPYVANIPDVDGFTQGKDIGDAIVMARDYIGNVISDCILSNNKLPEPGSVDYQPAAGQIKTYVDVDLFKFRALYDRVVKKTLTIPQYLNERGIAAGVNFSAMLTEALKERFDI